MRRAERAAARAVRRGFAARARDADGEGARDGEREGDEYFNEFCEMPADYDMWGEPGFDPGASGGGGYY